MVFESIEASFTARSHAAHYNEVEFRAVEIRGHSDLEL